MKQEVTPTKGNLAKRGLARGNHTLRSLASRLHHLIHNTTHNFKLWKESRETDILFILLVCMVAVLVTVLDVSLWRP